jgi:hypothetical protein
VDKRNITKSGIKYKGKKYIGPFLKEHGGSQVLIAEVKDEPKIRVYLNGSYIGTATEVGKEKINGGSEEMFGLGKKLKDYSNEDLIKELLGRYGVSCLKIREGQQYQVKGNGSRVKEQGPATVFVIRD